MENLIEFIWRKFNLFFDNSIKIYFSAYPFPNVCPFHSNFIFPRTVLFTCLYMETYFLLSFDKAALKLLGCNLLLIFQMHVILLYSTFPCRSHMDWNTLKILKISWLFTEITNLHYQK